MRTTLNIPDPIIRDAKRRAIEEDTTLTDLVIQGLKARLERGAPLGELPLSSKGGGLQRGVTWEGLEAADDQGENYR